MSNNLRLYPTSTVDQDEYEADTVSITATVYEGRGIQITLGQEYGRLSEAQIRDLIDVLERRIDPEKDCEATGMEPRQKTVSVDGETYE